MDKINTEIETLKEYLPTMLTDEELTEAIKKMVSEGKNNIGTIMGGLKATYSGKYDGKKASAIAQSLITGK